MIRYVVAILLTVVIVGLTFHGIDDAATEGTDRQIEAELDKIEAAATSLMDEEGLPNQDAPGPRRHLTLSFPEESLTTADASEIRLQLTDDDGESRHPVTSVEYVVDGQGTTQTTIDAPIREPPSSDTGGESSEHTVSIPQETDLELVLWLARDDDGDAVVYLEPASSFDGAYPDEQ